ncbi:nucleolar pre-ribosomal-associated protein 1 [Anguilla anguilla]|uniref:nucleolar pre-ribosomal-associated protein 1 n=1 Tax=Anguilla anguilla TaxID=7936 RepID=UPI0015B184EB|nr:nucleolar pre-ribosomal-associated protein 1 [Anguilla anguilla]
MAKKRAKEDSEESSTPAKKTKVVEVEFNGTVFKSMLKDPTKTMKGLETFISIAKKLPCPDLYDVVEGYIKVSMECAEIFKLLEGEKHTENELMLVFQSLEMILLRTATDLSHFSMVGSTIVKKTVTSFMKLLQSSLYSENHRFVRQCLCFLSAMVSQGPDTAREVFSQFQFSKGLSSLARRRDKMGRPDVRMAYIQFALSFLVSGDHVTIGQVLEMKDFLPDILSSGLKEDRISIVNLVLSTLQTKVVQNKAISKTQKVRFFGPSVLAQITSLYKWNGIVDASLDGSQVAENSEEAGKVVVRELTHNFLIDLCCSRKYGISFYDPSFGTAGRAGNIVLLQFLVGLKQATEDELMAELVVSVLKGSPDLLPRYFKETQYSFTPRLKSAWQDNVTLLKKIYEAQPEVSKAFQTGEFIPLPRLLTMVMVTSLPPVCNKAFFTQGLNMGNAVVQHTTLSLVSFILRRAQKNMEHCLDRAVWQSSEIYTPAMMEDFVQQYREALSKILPDMTSIVSKWQSLTKKGKPEEGATKGKPEEGATKGKKGSGQEKASKPPESGPDDAAAILFKALILQVICLYQKVVPHLVSQCTFDFSKLLKGIVSERGIKEEVPPVLQHQMLQLALDLPASKFSWFRVQDIVDTEAAGREKSVFYLLLKMFVSSSDGRLKTSTRMLVLKVLKDSGVFEYTWQELELWLSHLARLLPSQQEAVIHFLERVLVRLVSSPYTYMDKAAGVVQDAAYLQASLSGQEADAVSIPVSHIDDVLDMVDVIMEGSEGEVEDLGPSLSDDLITQTFPFSAVVPAILEARNNLPANFKDEKGVVYEYLASVLLDVLHSQRDPLPLCLALQQYDKELDSSESSGTPHPSVAEFHRYYAQWLPQQSREQLFKSCESSSAGPERVVSFTTAMQAAYSHGAAGLLQDSFREKLEEGLASLELSEFPVAVKQVLLYVKTTVDNFSTFSKESGVQVLQVLMEVLKALVNKLQSLEQAVEPVATEPQEGSELFLEADSEPGDGVSKDQVLLAVLGSIFKHPTLEQWFLARELGAFPAHSLNPVRLKRLCSELSDRTLALLQLAAPPLRALDGLGLVSAYLAAIERAVLKELGEEPASGAGPRESLPLRGLLALHEYMEETGVRAVISAALLLPQERLAVGVAGGAGPAELSAYGRAALTVLTGSGGRASHDRALLLSQAHLRGLATLLTSCASQPLEDFLQGALCAEPAAAALVPAEALLHCLRRPRPSAVAVAAAMLSNCSTHRLQFELWCLEPPHVEQLAGELNAFLPLLGAYLTAASQDDPAQPKDVQTAVLRALREALLAPLSRSVLSGDAEDPLSQRVDVLSQLISLAARPKDIGELTDGLPALLRTADGFERWKLVEPITDKLASSPEQLASWTKSLPTAALRWLISAYSTHKEQEKAMRQEEESMLGRVKELLACPQDVTPQDWNSFVKAGLKYRYRDATFLDTLCGLLEVMYCGDDTPKDLLPLATVHMMTTSHSLFLPSVLCSQEEANESPQSKEALVSLLLALVRKCPAVCDNGHFVLLLGAYGATLCTSDQKLLLILLEYERNNISLAEFQSVLWGPAAVEHHKACKSLGKSLWQQPSSEDLLALLSSDRMLNTVRHFPQQRRIIPQEAKELLYREEGVQDLGSLYDPCFLLPLFSSLLRPESVIDCYKFVSSHALGVTVAALSSYDPKVRAAAYQVLGCFHHHLEGARFREKRQLLYLLDTVKNGIRQQNLRLPFLLVTYIAKVAQQMLRPEEHMYMIVNKFLLTHQYLDLKKVPEFFRLFYSFDLEHKAEREWAVDVLREGLADRYCYELCDRQGIFQILLSFYSSPLCDESTQARIMEVLQQAGRVNKAAYELIKVHGLLTWILQVTERRYLENRVLCAVIDLVHVLWFTNLGQKESGGVGNTPSDGDAPQGPAKCLPLPLINEFLCVLLAFIRHLQSSVKARQLAPFLRTLSSVLQHRGSALAAHREMGRGTVPDRALSSTEGLALLQHWSQLSHDAPLQSALQGMAERHRVKELLSNVKDKGRSKGSSLRSRARAAAQPEEVGGDAERQEQAALEECEPHLRSILTHWESLPPPPSPASVSRGDLTAATAHLLVGWTLRSLVGAGPDPAGTLSFLRWVRANVLPHRAAVEAVLADAAVAQDFLRLLHRARRAGAETAELLTAVMVALLEARGGLSGDLHRAVLAACLPDPPQDDSSRGAGLQLLSVYIHELWSGAASPDLFLTHVRLVTGARAPGPKKGKCPAGVRRICTDISAAVDSAS